MDAATEFARLAAEYGTVEPVADFPGVVDHEVVAVVYRRNEDGSMTRGVDLVGGGITEGRLGEYQHHEALTGWPETEVYWHKASGVSLGFAPSRAKE